MLRGADAELAEDHTSEIGREMHAAECRQRPVNFGRSAVPRIEFASGERSMPRSPTIDSLSSVIGSHGAFGMLAGVVALLGCAVPASGSTRPAEPRAPSTGAPRAVPESVRTDTIDAYNRGRRYTHWLFASDFDSLSARMSPAVLRAVGGGWTHTVTTTAGREGGRRNSCGE